MDPVGSALLFMEMTILKHPSLSNFLAIGSIVAKTNSYKCSERSTGEFLDEYLTLLFA